MTTLDAMRTVLMVVVVGGAFVISCSAGSGGESFGNGSGDASSQDAGGDAGAIGEDVVLADGSGGSGGNADACPLECSDDFRRVVGCEGKTVELCNTDQMCADAQCQPACLAANLLRSSVGCEYFPVAMDGYIGSDNGCFAVFVANTWPTAAHLTVDFRGTTLDSAQFGYLSKGAGYDLEYTPYDPAKGIPPGEVGILFMAGPDPTNPAGAVECPEMPAITDGSAQVDGTGIGNAFHLVSDVPVVAYQILPYGGGNAAVTGASLLMPSGVWDTNYVAVNAYRRANVGTEPSLNIVALKDGTEVKMVPRVDVEAGGGVSHIDANTLMTIELQRGQQVQITQSEELTGSPIESNQPIAVFAGHECMYVPVNQGYCDHAEQQIPPLRALGHRYAAAPFRQRSSLAESVGYRILGVVDGTELTFDPAGVHSEQSVQFGEIIEFSTSQPFVVQSQDADHPFLVAAYMSGSETVVDGYGDPDFVRLVPPDQFLQRYVFFTDPTYPETNLVIVREKGPEGFSDVELACRGVLDGWQPIGTKGQFEYTHADLTRHDFEPQERCDNGRHEMKSKQPFGLTVWAWGSPETTSFTSNVSYGYPAGESVVQLNDIFIPSVPK